jgi:hypothetical protein
MSVHVTSWALRHSKSRLGDRLVLLVLADHAKDDGTYAWPSVPTIATQSNLSDRQVQRCLQNLVELGEIELQGKSKSGTHIYAVAGFIAHERGDNLSPPAEPLGVTSTTEGVTPMSPDLSVVQPSVEITPHKPPTELATAKAWKVDRVPVSFEDDQMARAVLAEWNELTEQRLTSKDWLAKIVMRVREHPDLSILDHGRVIRAALADPWWKGPASPSVVYGNGATFERALVAADAKPGLQPIKARRYGRGMTTEEILQRTGS